mmetsp:Transcript_19897/g.57161  ORF Transcript_19897/g.57161 Transcript_19897/m.57161 type:complete len:529 (+) Transcript_19897:168-1754(+)|eukprot:CAMPEP_0181036984 /NCGR_PEP_ID=MMETSP1070-20121207/9157_1 /TAXON_ID=265543 /ORGANISM="Minutocellus polymorphus, Strain NH13" /LENGTH=528 /DNA_ID=CAMNT_0023114665 /DNA_START=143 /DNA_END=1729 /DNA_ORIENTATION=-
MSTNPPAAAPNSANGGVNTNRPVACTNCHSAKVKCNFQDPCDRCVRLNKTCIPHVSQQGRGKKTRRKRKAGEEDGKTTKAARKSSAGSKRGGGTGKKGSAQQATEDVLCKSLGSAIAMQFHSQHYGIRFLIRSWVSFAIRRRSFMLLSRAALLASRVGLSMDDVMCEKDVVVTTDGADGAGDDDDAEGVVEAAVAAAVAEATGLTQTSCGGSTSYHQGPVDFLYPALIMPADQQDLGDSRLRWSEIPSDLLASAGCCAKSAGLGAPVPPDGDDDLVVMDCERRKEEVAKVKACQNATDFASVVEDKDEQEILAPLLGDRWIFVREMKQGQSRYFCSPAFERNVASWESIKDVWVKNEQEVVSLFYPPNDKAPYVRALMHQITLHEKANVCPRANRCSSKILVKSRDGAGGDERKLVRVAQISCMKIINVDCCYFYNEYVPVEKETAETLALMSSTASATSESRRGSLASQPPQAVTPPLPPQDSANATGGGPGAGTAEWLNLDQVDELGDLNELMDFLDEARSDFGIL